MQLSKEEYARKKSIMVVWCELKILSLRITVRHREAFEQLPSWQNFQSARHSHKDCYNKENEIFFIRTYVTDENVICRTYVTYKNMIFCILFCIWKCVMSISGLLFQNLDSCISKLSKKFKREGQFHLFLRFGPRHSLFWW